MKSRKLTCITAMTLLAALATPTRLAAQEQQEQARTFTVLHAFTGLSSGGYPAASLVRDSAGNLYGTTSAGGDLACGGNGLGCGVVFKLDTTGKETVLYRFTGGAAGSFPTTAGLVRDAAGNLYGTTFSGGDLACGNGFGCGVVFKVGTTGKETVLHSFTGGADGRNPMAGLVRDAAGNLYGTTFTAGDLDGGFGSGVVFKLDTTGKETVLYSFEGGADGTAPAGGLLRDAAGNLYGTTYAGGDLGCTPYGGGSGCGVVFKLDTTGKETVLHSFTGGAAGADPEASLVRDNAGNFYGTTFTAGDLACGGSGFGCGLVFKLDTTGKETVLHRFTGGADGRNPGSAGLVRDSAGNLYGTTSAGGDLACSSGFGCGVVFKLDTTGKETVLHSFTGRADGAFPEAGLVRDAAGNLYGTASSGGDLACGGGGGCGVVFKLTTGKSTTSTSFVSSLNPSIYGQKVTWTATVTSSGSIMPTGTVRFKWQYFTETFTIGSATLNSSGVATITKSNLNADAFPLTAVYSGDAANLGSTSAVLNQVVLETTSAATLTSSPNPSTQGQAVTFTAKISSPAVTPTGPVTFTSGKTVLGTAQLSGGKATLTTSSLAVGSTTVTVTYYGDSNIVKSSASVVQTVH